jgi:hypothetical protein
MATGAASDQAGKPSGDDIGRQAVIQPGDLVPELELAFLQPRDLELVRPRPLLQGVHGRVQILVGLTQIGDFNPDNSLKIGLAFVVRHGRKLANPASKPI